jgi:ParB family chromosome partitioning protein
LNTAESLLSQACHPAEIYGALREGVQIADFTFDRVCFHLEWLLQNDRWHEVGPGFDDVNDFLASISLGPLRVSAEQRKRIAKLIKDLQPEASQRKIAGVLGVNQATVHRDLSGDANASVTEGNSPDTHASDGHDDANASPPSTVAARPIRGTQGTSDNEWCTPAEYIEVSRAVLGTIDLDPATTEKANETIKAARIFTKDDDGLKHEWHGSVFLNPPYAQPLIAQFVSKMVAERKAGRVTAAIMLTHNYTSSSWFREAASAADAICFTRSRVKLESDGKIASPTQGQAFFYFGEEVEAFRREFGAVGLVLLARFERAIDATPSPPETAPGARGESVVSDPAAEFSSKLSEIIDLRNKYRLFNGDDVERILDAKQIDPVDLVALSKLFSDLIAAWSRRRDATAIVAASPDEPKGEAIPESSGGRQMQKA